MAISNNTNEAKDGQNQKNLANKQTNNQNNNQESAHKSSDSPKEETCNKIFNWYPNLQHLQQPANKQFKVKSNIREDKSAIRCINNSENENSPALDDLVSDFVKWTMNKNYSNNIPEIKFPLDKLAKLDVLISRPRWIIPVLPKGELERLLLASIDLAKQNLDTDFEPCQNFYKKGLTISFTKILCDEAVTGWKPEIHKCIFRNCKHLVELCALKLNLSNDVDCLLTFLELLAILFNPNNKFHTHNEKETAFPSEFLIDEDNSNVETDKDEESNEISKVDDDLVEQKNDEFQYATSFNKISKPNQWLVELIEDFGRYGGFEKIKLLFNDSIKSGSLNVALVSALIRPFGLCYEYLTEQTVNLYFKEIIVEVPKLLQSSSNNEVKKESKLENKNDQITSIIKSLKDLATRLDDSKKYLEQLEILRLENILKLLKISSFNGKMNALNEINKVIGSVDSYSNIIPTVNPLSSINDEERYITSTSVAQWIKENQVLQIVLKDSLHQPQYVEKLEKIIRFIIKEKQLTLQDLDDLWSAQCGKHEAIVKNMHDLLAKLAWDFTPEQLDHLFECFQNSWTTASKKQREKLLELIRTLAEDDKDGLMAHKVLNLLWSLAHSNDLPTEIMDQALAAHIKILDYSCCQDRDQQKAEWLDRCILELTREDSDPNWVIPALKQIREICCLYFISSNVQSINMHQRMSNNNVINQTDVITRLQSEHNLVEIVSKNLQAFMEKARLLHKENPNLDPNKIYGNNRYSHVQEIKERLSFLRFLLKEGHLWLCEPQAIQIWNCLIQNSVYREDREEAFSWFSQLMNDEPDLDPELNRVFFENQILKLDPILLTESGIECFDKFFKVVNLKENKLIFQNNHFYTTNLDLIGLDYLTRIVLNGIDEVSNAAIELLKAIYSNLSNCSQGNKLSIIKEFILSSMDRLKAFYDTILVLEESNESSDEKQHKLIKMARFLKLLYEYLNQCDLNYGDERIYLPMVRSFRGKNITILIRMQNQNRAVEDVVIETHSNETLLNIKKQYLSKLKMLNNNMEVDFYLNGEHLDQDINRDKKLVSDLTTKDHFILTARVLKSNYNSINDNEVCSQNNLPLDIVNQFRIENGLNEDCLPSVYMSNYPSLYKSLFDFADLGLKLKYKPIYINSLEILKLMPIDKSRSDSLIQLCKLDANSPEFSQLKEQSFGNDSPTKLCYTLGVIYSLLMPANNPLSNEALEFQVNFIKSGVANEVQKFITKKDFLDKADDLTKVCAYSIVLEISKFVLKTIANYLVQSGLSKQNDQFKILPKCLDYLQNTNEDFIICQAARKTANALINYLKKQQKLNQFKVDDFIPDFEIINFVLHFIWSTASGKETLTNNKTIENLHHAILESKSDSESTTIFNICEQGLEVLTIMLMLSPSVFLKLIEGKKWEAFTMDLILFSSEKSVRIASCEQFAFIATMCCSNENDVLKYYIKFLNQHLQSTIPKNYKSSSEFFQLYCKLLNNAYLNKVHLPEMKKYLHYEIDLLKNVKERLLVDGLIEDIQLEGHLCIIKELVMMLNSDEKYQIGCKMMNEDLNSTDEQYDGLLVMLIDEYIFTSSKLMVAQQKLSQRNILGSAICDNSSSINLINKNNSSSNSPYNSLSCIYSGDVDAICQNSATLEAAFDLIVALCIGCIPNLKYVCDNLIEMFYLDHEITLTEWEYFPAIGCRPLKGFVGLKNGGATCYMNSIIQQLYMIPEIRDGLLSVEGAIDDSQVEFYDDDTMNLPVNYYLNNNDQQNDDNKIRKDYNVGVIKHLQGLFGHLTLNKLQYYTPKGFWSHFKLWGEPINLREQHDALEFFNSLVDSIDEGLNKLNYNKLMASVLSGSFADQKICKDCPHRYSREESFTTLNIDIRNHSNLLDSLEQYVKGDLLEGANAYHCEKCNRKVDTVKRLCIKKLPIILTIQLKRFDYDWERGCSIKFNDYFEFPRMLDMEPYTVNGLAKIDGEVIEDIIEQDNIDLEIEVNDSGEGINTNANTSNKDTTDQEVLCTKYELCGIVVHSGQASGGHYYSYILHKDTDGAKKWYKFDDGEVNECKLDEEEEMKNQCFGGDYLGEVFDHMLKRVSCRKQKRWWSAYILFYRRIDTEQCQFSLRLNELVLSNANINSNLMRTSSSTALIKQNSGDSEQRKQIDTNPGEFYLRIPTPIRRSVQRQNIKFMHMRNQFNSEYFQFIKNLTSSNHDQLLNQYGNFLNNEFKSDSFKENYLNGSPSSITKEDSKSSTDQLLAQQQTEISFLCTKLLSKFLFTTCFHTKKSLRGSAIEWNEILTMHLRTSPMIRAWFAHNILIETPCRFSEYLLECISNDIRNVFVKLVIFISHYALLDGPNCQVEIEMDDGRDIVQCGQPLSDYIMQLVLDLLKKDPMERHLNHFYNQYFNLFYQYCILGRETRAQLIKLNVPAKFMNIALDESVIPSGLHQVVSILVRSCDISSKCKSACSTEPILPNPYGFDNGPICNLPADAVELLFFKSHYVKKVTKEATNLNETFLFLKYCCWENPRISKVVLEELIWHVAFYYDSDLKPYLDLLLNIVLMQDSWQKIRIINALSGATQNEKNNLLDTILRDKIQHQKRAYHCIKFLVSLFTNCEISLLILQNDIEIRDKFSQAVNWLNDELDQHSLNSNQYGYNWSSNEGSNTYRLIRSNSARITLAKAINLCPKEEFFVKDKNSDSDTKQIVNVEVKENNPTENISSESNQVMKQPDQTGKTELNKQKYEVMIDEVMIDGLIDTFLKQEVTSTTNEEEEQADSPKKFFKLSEI